MVSARLWATLVACLCSSTAMAASSATQDYLRLKAKIVRQMAARDFAATATEAEKAVASHARWADGSWIQSFVYQEFGAALSQERRDDKSWSQIEHQLAALSERRPQAWLLYVEALNAHAWQARGDRVWAAMDAGARETFNHMVTTERQTPDANKRILAGIPDWYSMRMRAATEGGESPSTVAQLFVEGSSRYPSYPTIYCAMLRDASPMWHGSAIAQRAVLNGLSHAPGSADADGLFVRLIWNSESTASSLLHDKELDEQALRRSAKAMAGAYPDQFNIQKLFRTACERSDKLLASELLGQVQQPLVVSAWAGNPSIFESCRDWARGKVEAFVIREHVGDEIEEFLVN